MRKLNSAVERFALRHPNFGVANLMLYIVIGNAAAFFLLASTVMWVLGARKLRRTPEYAAYKGWKKERRG